MWVKAGGKRAAAIQGELKPTMSRGAERPPHPETSHFSGSLVPHKAVMIYA